MSKRRKSKEKVYDEEYSREYTSYPKGTLFGISFSNNPEQQELIRLINENRTPIIYCFGDAGTGKTFTALAAALDLVKLKKKYRKIYYIREPEEVGKSLGFLPGDLGDKYGVYLGGLEDNLNNISEMTGINVRDLKYFIEGIPPQYTRGRSFMQGSILIVDEAQNLTLDTIQTLCTRIGKFSKIIFLGSLKQVDNKALKGHNNDFKKSYEILMANEATKDLVGRIDLIKSERSDYCRVLDEAFNSYKEQKEVSRDSALK